MARKLALQALYRWQLNACPGHELVQEFGEAEDMPRAENEYFRALVEGMWRGRAELDARLATFADREPQRLDPIGHAILLIGLYELTSRPVVPYRVAHGARGALREHASACIDVSDGLLADAGKLAAASRAGAQLAFEAVPVSEPLLSALSDARARAGMHQRR